jgi:hypothetical protein
MNFLVNCARCGNWIARGSVCPNCHYEGDQPKEESNPDDPEAPPKPNYAVEYWRRHRRHMRNYTIFMGLILLTALVAIYTAYLWYRVIYTPHSPFGPGLWNIAAFILVGLANVVTLIMGGLIAASKRLFPREMYCPACNVRLDELGLTRGRCPGCNVLLRPPPGTGAGEPES